MKPSHRFRIVAAALVLVVLASACEAATGDYTGDRKADPVYVTSDGVWHEVGQTAPLFTNPSGVEVLPVPGDYDGDGKTDIAVYRPTDSTFHYISSKTGQTVVVRVGVPGDYPVPADYEHLGHAEAAVTDWSGANWYIAGQTTPIATFATSFGDALLPAAGDFDGDGKTDAGVLDLSDGVVTWSAAGQAGVGTIDRSAWGLGDVATPASFTMNVTRIQQYEWCITDPSQC